MLVTRPAQERRAQPNDSIVMVLVTDPVRGLSDGEEVVLGAPPSSRRGVPPFYASVMGRPSLAPDGTSGCLTLRDMGSYREAPADVLEVTVVAVLLARGPE